MPWQRGDIWEVTIFWKINPLKGQAFSLSNHNHFCELWWCNILSFLTMIHCKEPSLLGNKVNKKRSPFQFYNYIVFHNISRNWTSSETVSLRHHTEHGIIFAPITLLDKGEISPHALLTLSNPNHWAELWPNDSVQWLHRTKRQLNHYCHTTTD